MSAPTAEIAAPPRTAALLASTQRRKQDSRERLLAAATARFCEDGYLAVSVDDIVQAAGVSRVTFYRHFAGKAALAIELHEALARAAVPRLLSIEARDADDPEAVRAWLADLFAADRANRRLLRLFTQAAVAEPSFQARAHQVIGEVVTALGAAIPAFAADPHHPAERRRWLEAWLLVFEIVDQSNHAALDSGVAADPLVIDILTDRFVAFVRKGGAG